MIPNFVQQITWVENKLIMVSTSVAHSWKDSNKEQFYDSYMNEYEKKLESFVHGGPENYGMGLDELLNFLDRKEREMEMLGRL